MSSSIYEFVRLRLIKHGAPNTVDGRLIIGNKRLFLNFVRLERAVRSNDFEEIQNAVSKIERYTLSIGKRHLVLFAYMYLYLSDVNKKRKWVEETLPSGIIQRTSEYLCKASSTERLIGDWAGVWYERYSKSYFRALYASNSTA